MSEPVEEVQPVVRPFSAFLVEQRKGRLHAEASDGFRELVAAVRDTRMKGSIVITIEVKPTKGDHLAVTDKCVVKIPHATGESLFFVDRDGNLSRSDPNQPELPMSVAKPQGVAANG